MQRELKFEASLGFFSDCIKKKKQQRGNSEAHLTDHIRLSASSKVVLESLLKGSQHDLDGQDHRRACRKRIVFWELFWLS